MTVAVEGIAIPDEQAAEAVSRCVRAIGYLDRLRDAADLKEVRAILVGESLGQPVVIEAEAEHFEVEGAQIVPEAMPVPDDSVKRAMKDWKDRLHG